jgi:Putative peptidoglycan binding domain
MKRLFATICIGSIALALTAQGVENNDQRTVNRGRKAQSAQKASTTRASQATGHRTISTARSNNRVQAAPQRTANATVRQNNMRNTRTEAVRARNVRNESAVRTRNESNFNRRNATVNRERNLAVNRQRNVAVNRERNVTVNQQRNVNVNRVRNVNNINRVRNVTVTNNWRGISGRRYAAFRNYHREWHDRGWWTSHYNQFVFVFGAPYYWNAGYWYPAWGYNPGYIYPYDGPIYGYNGLSPDQVVVNVQSELQRDGYYAGPIDGLLGPETRQAIADFQADNGLAVTSAVDEPTLATLGLV